jgi:hypothetical protein
MRFFLKQLAFAIQSLTNGREKAEGMGSAFGLLILRIVVSLL